MEFYDPPSPTTAQFQVLFDQVQAAVPLPTYTVATLPVPGPTYLNRLAGVTDLFGNRTTRVRCEKVTVGGVDRYYWQPQSSDSYGDLDVAGANMTIGALTMPTSLNLVGNLGAGIGRTVTLADGAFPGQLKELRMAGTLGLGSTLNILGTGLGSGLALLFGGYAKWASDWSTGSPVWKRLV